LARNDRFGANNQSLIGRGCVKTKTDLAVKQFCKIQTSKSRRFESRLGFLARFAQFAKVPRVLTPPRPRAEVEVGEIPAWKQTSQVPKFSLVANPESIREDAESVGEMRDMNEGGGTAKKTQTTVRISSEMLAFFRASGRGWQTRMDAVLRKYVAARQRQAD
jgi:uncharacterized protein (DUF4415 family)